MDAIFSEWHAGVRTVSALQGGAVESAAAKGNAIHTLDVGLHSHEAARVTNIGKQVTPFYRGEGVGVLGVAGVGRRTGVDLAGLGERRQVAILLLGPRLSSSGSRRGR